jgi:hypothetical protein
MFCLAAHGPWTIGAVVSPGRSGSVLSALLSCLQSAPGPLISRSESDENPTAGWGRVGPDAGAWAHASRAGPERDGDRPSEVRREWGWRTGEQRHRAGEVHRFSPDQQKAIFDACHRAGIIVQSHQGSVETLRAAVEAGVDMVQHRSRLLVRSNVCASWAHGRPRADHRLGGGGGV